MRTDTFRKYVSNPGPAPAQAVTVAVADDIPARGPAFSRILVAVDASPQAQYALDVASRLATQVGASVTLAHFMMIPATYATAAEFVVPDADLYASRLATAERVVANARRRLPADLSVEAVVREGDPAEEIVRAASDCRADLIVMGTHARGHIARAVLGSVADAVTRHAPCPVLTVAHPPPPRR